MDKSLHRIFVSIEYSIHQKEWELLGCLAVWLSGCLADLLASIWERSVYSHPTVDSPGKTATGSGPCLSACGWRVRCAAPGISSPGQRQHTMKWNGRGSTKRFLRIYGGPFGKKKHVVLENCWLKELLCTPLPITMILLGCEFQIA